jgi:ubiquinol-cytochrome c reductase cytochrome c1 subunit
MKEIKILLVVVFFTLVTYWGVEPFAHSQMHPHVADADYTFSDIKEEVGKGDATKGAALVQENCIACHGIKSQGFAAPMDDATSAMSYGVVPPDLSTAGILYSDKYLAAFIKDPAIASKVAHKFEGDKVHPMPSYNWMEQTQINDMVAYLKSIAPSKISNRDAFIDACGRCHNMKYADDINGKGFRIAGGFKASSDVSNYMGKTPPDLSQYIRSRGDDYLHKFINDPQKLLHGTAMPRVGLTKEAETQVIKYLEEIGDSKKPQRDSLGISFLIYTIIFAIFAYLWKIQVWRKVK